MMVDGGGSISDQPSTNEQLAFLKNAERKNHSGVQRVQKPELLHHEEQARPSGARRVEEVLPALQQAPVAQGNEVNGD